MDEPHVCKQTFCNICGRNINWFPGWSGMNIPALHRYMDEKLASKSHRQISENRFETND